MKTLNTIIKLHKNRLHSIQRQLGSLNSKRQNLVHDLNNITLQAEAEFRQYCVSKYSFVLEDYIKNVELLKDNINTSIRSIDVNITELRENLFDEFAQLKKFEIALQNRKKQSLLEEKKNETKHLDELNILKSNSL